MNSERIDVHHHLLTPQYIEELANVGVLGSGGGPFPHWKPEDSLVIMERYNIRSALLSVSSPGICLGNAAKNRAVARSLNEFAAQSVTRWPKQFGFFATLPLPDVEASLSEISYAFDQLSADGIGLLSNYAGIYLGDPRFEAIFAELDRRAAVVFIHPTVFTGNEIPAARNAGSPIPTLPSFLLEFVFDTTRAVTNLLLSGTLKRYPNIRIILSHAGGTTPFLASKIANGVFAANYMQRAQADSGGPGATRSPEMAASSIQAARQEGLHLLSNLYYDTALSANANALSSLQQLVPASHILWGSDYPFAPEMEIRSSVNGIAGYAGFSEQDRQDIQTNNALTLFPRLQTP